MAEQDLDRNLPATPYKLEQARRKGSVPRAQDLSSVVTLAMLVVACHVLAEPMMRQWAHLNRQWWSPAGFGSIDPARANTLLSELGFAAVHMMAPLLLAIVIGVIAASLLQSGPVLSAEPIKPDFNRVNPAQGFKRLFSLKTVYVAGKSLVKLALLAGVFWWAFEALVGSLLAVSWLPAKAQTLRLPATLAGMLTKLWLVLLLLALIDLLYTRWEFARQMRMSHRELKDEIKHREGDPRIRRRLRELRMEMLKRSQSLRQVPSADVLITNPTRVAVALKYDRASGLAPQLVAKGAGGLARQMRELAWRHGVTVVQNPPLARSLYRHVELDGAVPPQWYATVAKILVWVYASRQRQGAGKGAAA